MVKRKSQGCLVVFVVLGIFACFLSVAVYLKYKPEDGGATVRWNNPKIHEDENGNIGIGDKETLEKSGIKFSGGEMSFGSTATTDVKEFTNAEEASKFLKTRSQSEIIRTVDLPNGNIRIWYVRYGREPLSVEELK